MATIIFAIVAVIFIAIVYFWVRGWHKDEEKITIPINEGGSQVNNEQATPTIIGWLRATEDVLFGKDGKLLVKGETFYQGKIRKNSQLYFRLQVGMSGSAVLCGINDEVAKPRFQVAVQFENKQCISNPCNSQRQSVQPYMVHNGESIWVSSDVLNGIDLPEYFVLRFFYRIDNGSGYGSWQIADAINIHNL
jgi:hypothetical protein